MYSDSSYVDFLSVIFMISASASAIINTLSEKARRQRDIFFWICLSVWFASMIYAAALKQGAPGAGVAALVTVALAIAVRWCANLPTRKLGGLNADMLTADNLRDSPKPKTVWLENEQVIITPGRIRILTIPEQHFKAFMALTALTTYACLMTLAEIHTLYKQQGHHGLDLFPVLFTIVSVMRIVYSSHSRASVSLHDGAVFADGRPEIFFPSPPAFGPADQVTVDVEQREEKSVVVFRLAQPEAKQVDVVSFQDANAAAQFVHIVRCSFAAHAPATNSSAVSHVRV